MSNAVSDLVQKLPCETQSKDNFDQKVCLLIDGNAFKSQLPYHYQTIVDGDALCLSIACASIVAKVTRDRILKTYDKIFPQYGFSQHKGYPTPEHKKAIRVHGLSLIHRRSFVCT